MRKIISLFTVLTLSIFMTACGGGTSRSVDGKVTCYTGNLKIIDSDATDIHVNYHGSWFRVDGVRHETTPGTTCVAVFKK